ncbi:MAG: ABC transporter substrate-binding protein, partial [Sneathiella sp.]|nr:ABC transporter substrate-binding protein [Sneathiella sp.]
EPERTAPNMRRLIEDENVLAVIGNVGTPTAISAIPIANEGRTLFFAPFTGAGVLRKTPPDRYVINFRASYTEETSAIVDALMEHGGLRPEEVAFFTQRDGYGDAGYAGGISALLKNGLQSDAGITHGRYERNTLAVENALADILLAEPEPKAVIMVGAYAPCAKLIQLARQLGVTALFINISFVGSAPLARVLGDKIEGVVVTQVVPHPTDISVPIVRNYLSSLNKFSKNGSPSFGGLEGYISSEILIRALRSIEGLPTRENVIDALEGMGEFDVGVGPLLYFDKTHHQASHSVWPTVLQRGRFVPFNWDEISGFLSNE